jgi:hypothetical protein
MQVDLVARGLAVFATLISFGGLWLAWRNYRRAGVRVVVSAEKQVKYQVFYVNGPVYDDVLAVRVSSKGLAKVQISSMFYEVKGRKGFVTLDPNGPPLPFVLEGMHQELWAPTLSTIAKGADLGADGTSQLRAGVLLGDGTQKFSRWLTLSADEVTRR